MHMARYEKKVTDYNFGCLIRTDAREEYGENNTIFGQYLQSCIILDSETIPQ